MSDGRIYTDEQFERMFEQAVIRHFEETLDEIPPREELEKMHTFSQRHNDRMEKLFRCARRQDRLKTALRWTLRAATVASVVTGLLFGALMVANPEVRAAVSETIIQWFDKFTKFTGAEAESDTQEVGNWLPNYLPDGFEETDFIDLGGIIKIIYENPDGGEIYFTAMTSDGSASVNNEGVDYQRVFVGETEYHLFEAIADDEYSSVVWIAGGHMFEIYGSVPINELQAVAVSVTPQ